MDQGNVSETTDDVVHKAQQAPLDLSRLSLESLILLLKTERLRKLESDSHNELNELRTRQQQVAFLHKLMKTINALTSAKKDLDLSKLPEPQKKALADMMKEAKEMGVELDLNKASYNSDERERLLENIKMTVDDLNVQNDMQLQMVSRLTNERYEAYQMARTILKPLHDDKISKARAIAGR